MTTEKRSSNGQIQTYCHSSTTRNCRNNSTVQYGIRDTDRTSSLYRQTFRICVRSLFWKAKWDDFSTDFDEAIEEVEPIPANYDRFIGLVRVVSRRHIPRGCRTNYIPGLTKESQNPYEAYKKQYSNNPFARGTLGTGNKLIDTMK